MEQWQATGKKEPQTELDRRPVSELDCGCLVAWEFTDSRGTTYMEYTVVPCIDHI